MKTVIYHSADYDGIFCREISKKFLGTEGVNYIGWNFGDPPLKDVPEGPLFILDLPVDKPLGLTNPNWIDEALENSRTLIWIDHHKSSIESHPKDIPGYRIDGVAACRLAWQWFGRSVAHASETGHGECVPSKHDFIDRKVSEPLAVRLAGEYDVWDKRDPDADTFQYGLRFVEKDSDFWEPLLQTNEVGQKAVRDVLGYGTIAQQYQQKIDADLVTYRSYRLTWEGLNWIVLNTGRLNSLTFAALDNPETGHDALLGYMFNGKCWTVSLYHAKDRTDLDLSQIAIKHGGGGHRGACGFTCDKLPFLS